MNMISLHTDTRAHSHTAAQQLVDKHGRPVRYLRISITDRCNLACRYCRGQNSPFIPHERILRFEEIEQIVALGIASGVNKVRFTGGEPFVRKGFLPFLQRIHERFPSLDIRLTSNGTLLGDALESLKKLRVNVNLSLDTLNREKFAAITGRDLLPTVLENMQRMLQLGIRLKVNAVAMHGVNHDDLPALAALSMDAPIDVRFIEFMPMGTESIWSDDTFWPAASILADMSQRWQLLPAAHAAGEAGPARLWKLRKGKRLSVGHMGIISSVSQCFCSSCNRLRLTADGHLRTCLYDDREYAIRNVLRRLGPEAVRRILLAAVARKPVGADLLARRHGPVARKQMSAIGG